jgi:hypothetical protein
MNPDAHRANCPTKRAPLPPLRRSGMATLSLFAHCDSAVA